jgi:predicted cupin superfamily sugar epimerase
LSIDLRDRDQPAQVICQGLGLSPHPEGGHYRETWRDMPPDGGRGASTGILFLLMAGERSRWHRVDATEIWLWQAGAPLLLSIADPGRPPRTLRLGPDLASG